MELFKSLESRTKSFNDPFKHFEINQPLKKLPEATSDQEKFFITGKNIYTTFYNTKNLELIYQKHLIKAPFDGILTSAQVDPGTVIRTGQLLGNFIDPTEYEMTGEGLMKACIAEVYAEAEDSGDMPMYSDADLLQSAKWKFEDILNDISQLVEAHL